MTFARYIGGGGAGQFTQHKTYIAQQRGLDAINVDAVCIADDSGQLVSIELEDDHRFKFVEEVYVVVLQGIPDWDIHAGEILEAIDVSKDVTKFRIRSGDDSRMLSRDWFEIVDWTNLQVGMELKDVESGHWGRIESVDEQMRVRVHPDKELRLLDEYALSVTSGEIDRVRIARCINSKGAIGITEGNTYRVLREYSSSIKVNQDTNSQIEYDAARFEFV